jgi:hypothetical protein
MLKKSSCLYSTVNGFLLIVLAFSLLSLGIQRSTQRYRFDHHLASDGLTDDSIPWHGDAAALV